MQWPDWCSMSAGMQIDGRKAGRPKPQLPLISRKINCHKSCYVTETCSLPLLPDLLQHAPPLPNHPPKDLCKWVQLLLSLPSDRPHHGSCCCTPRLCAGVLHIQSGWWGLTRMTFHPLGRGYLILPETETWQKCKPGENKTWPARQAHCQALSYQSVRLFVLLSCARHLF